METSSDANQQPDATANPTNTGTTSQIKLLVRTARVQKFIDINESASVKDLRQKAAVAFEVDDPILTVLIFGGKILKDHEDLKTHGIKDGQTIHLVIRNKPASADNFSSTTAGRNANTASSNLNSNNLNNNNIPNSNNNNNNSSNNNNNNNGRQSFPSMSPLLGNLGDVQQRLQQMLISNPETMQNMINPLMQQMMSNPDTIRSLFGSMQRMHSLMERNPEVNHLLSNPDVLRESLEMVRNPAALQEVMRNYDRALNNMESMQGGYNVLRRMYTEFQEPLLSAFQENANQFSTPTNPDANHISTYGSNSDVEQQRTENRDPLPNPWATPAQPMPNNQNSRTQFPLNLFGNGENTPGGLAEGLNAGLNGPLGGNLGDLGNAFATMGQMDLPNANELVQAASTLFQDQEFMSLLTNPEALQTLLQIQQGFERLRRIAPNLFERLGLSNIPGLNLNSSTNNNNNNNNNDNNNGDSGNTDASGQRDKDKDGTKDQEQ